MSPKGTSSYEIPGANEKLPYKFILDALNQQTEDETHDDEGVEVVVETVIEKTSPKKPPQAISVKQEKIKHPRSIPVDRKYFRIGDAAQIIGVEPYVLRYWENEFSGIRPMKSKTGHRVYSRKNMEDFLRIRHLLYIEKFSVKGAQKQLRQPPRPIESQTDHSIIEEKHRKRLKALAVELKQLISLARGNPGSFVLPKIKA